MNNYLINLDSETERLADTTELFESAHMTFQRISAVNAKKLSPEEIKQKSSPVIFYLANARRCRLGEIACSLSHIKCWNTAFTDQSADVAAVYEDDVIFNGNELKKHLAAIETENDPDIPTVWLLHKGLPKARDLSSMWYNILLTGDIGHTWCTPCYALNAAAAKRITKLLTPIRNPCDSWSTFARCGVRILAASQPCAATRGTVSTIQRKSNLLWKISLFRKLYWIRFRFAFWFDLLVLKSKYLGKIA